MLMMNKEEKTCEEIFKIFGCRYRSEGYRIRYKCYKWWEINPIINHKKDKNMEIPKLIKAAKSGHTTSSKYNNKNLLEENKKLKNQIKKLLINVKTCPFSAGYKCQKPEDYKYHEIGPDLCEIYKNNNVAYECWKIYLENYKDWKYLDEMEELKIFD